MFFQRLWIVFVLFTTLSACSSMRDLGQWMGINTDAVDRRSAEAESNEAIGVAEAPQGPGSRVPASVDGTPQLLDEDAAQRGFRRNGDPWNSGTASNEGSLWTPDNPDAYLFSKNLNFRAGDFLYLTLDSEFVDLMNLKVKASLPTAATQSAQDVIAKEAGKAAGKEVEKKVGDAAGNAAVGEAVGGAIAKSVEGQIKRPRRYVDITEFPVRVTEVLPRGVLKVEGNRNLIVDSVPYSMKLSGVVREQDLGPTYRIAVNRLMDSKVEVIK